MKSKTGGVGTKASACTTPKSVPPESREVVTWLRSRLLEGPVAARDSIKRGGSMTDFLEEVFKESLKLLERVHTHKILRVAELPRKRKRASEYV